MRAAFEPAEGVERNEVRAQGETSPSYLITQMSVVIQQLDDRKGELARGFVES